ncbi:hypothetical protein ACVWYG_003117 [Pedobacter sp. UYEF25]
MLIERLRKYFSTVVLLIAFVLNIPNANAQFKKAAFGKAELKVGVAGTPPFVINEKMANLLVLQ